MTRPVIWLAANEAKCTGSGCRKPEPCARREVAYTPGRPVADYSVPGPTFIAECTAPVWSKWVSVAAAVKPVAAPVVREWIGGRA